MITDSISRVWISEGEVPPDILARLIAKEGHTPYVARTGEEGLLLLEREEIDLVLLDRTREGYVEIIEMGELTNSAQITAVTHTAAGVPNAYYAPKTSADAGFTWSFDKDTKLSVGGSNIFNAKPSRQDPNETDNGFIYDSVQFGLNGAAYFVRLWKRF